MLLVLRRMLSGASPVVRARWLSTTAGGQQGSPSVAAQPEEKKPEDKEGGDEDDKTKQKTKKKKGGKWKWVLGTVASLVAAPYFTIEYQLLDKMRPAKPAGEENAGPVVPPHDDKALAESLRGKSLEELDVVLYQYEYCPFCNKVKAFLNYHGIPYKTVEVNPLSKEEIQFSEGYKKVPILQVEGHTLCDSTNIVTVLNEKLFGRVEDDFEVRKWLFWIDNSLIHDVAPNVYGTWKEARQAFGYLSQEVKFQNMSGTMAQWVGTLSMWFLTKYLKKKYDIPNPRRSLYEHLNEWVDDLPSEKPFMGGDEPDVSDLSLYGVLQAFRTLTVHDDMLEHCKIGDWYRAMESAVGESSRTAQL